ncbi:winged helix-turn-helix domain-containing protein [Klebsiella pneumoniae]
MMSWSRWRRRSRFPYCIEASLPPPPPAPAPPPDVQISRLRRMVEEDPAHPRYIQTVWGLGYVFVPDGSKA